MKTSYCNLLYMLSTNCCVMFHGIHDMLDLAGHCKPMLTLPQCTMACQHVPCLTMQIMITHFNSMFVMFCRIMRILHVRLSVQDEKEIKVDFPSMGNTADIPRGFKTNNRVRNKNITKRQTEITVKEIWKVRMAHRKAGKAGTSLVEMIFLHLQKTKGLQQAVLEVSCQLLQLVRLWLDFLPIMAVEHFVDHSGPIFTMHAIWSCSS